MRKSIYCTNESPVYISDYMGGKMEGIPAISTSCKLNPYCAARAKDPNSICYYCYAQKTLNCRKSTAENVAENNAVLAEVLPLEVLPRFKKTVSIVRFEAFGDLFNEAQAINYFNIAAVNPHVHFALWTKNKGIYRRAVEAYSGKPENLMAVYSASKVNEPEPLPPYFDKVFTVWTDENTCNADGFEINCGARACGECGECYLDDLIAAVNELLK